MNVETFFQHYGIQQNPFAAEEARLDPVFSKITASRGAASGATSGGGHPDFDKIMGDVADPSTAVVFGEKGSGKTAIRLQIGQAVQRHNREQTDRRVLMVAYDDLNPMFDNLLRANRQSAKAVFKRLRLADHQDAILSLAVTRLVSGLLADGSQAAVEETKGELPAAVLSVPGADAGKLPGAAMKKLLKRMPRDQRVDLAALAALYDQPRAGDAEGRFAHLCKKLRLGWRVPHWFWLQSGVLLLLTALVLWLVHYFMDAANQPWWLLPALGLVLAGAVLSVGWWAWQAVSLWYLVRQIRKETPAINRPAAALRHMLEQLPGSALKRLPWPQPSKQGTPASESRYQWTRALVDAITAFGYRGVLVLVDRVDEPTLVSGDAEKMKAAVWPMFDNKFLKQSHVGVKLLLPLELRHQLFRESPAFFQEARLDKQNMVERLSWSGTMLYDLCSLRLRVCRPDGEAMELRDLFEDSVTQTILIDALNEMQQPRDAFKFLYRTLQEHCSLTPESQPVFKIARLTLETVRRDQARRVQEFHRGLTPA